ncbi:hypothetical protein [Streptomyces cupreus]|uniref:Uncharacterized protein n=1 Tax=Streptomyces cupreus TaxID=2759956 RepID=A0A7X1J2V1_9ACTN|nr:hypothetical protein [Streptomyces cupreus]MBC2903206.1 hypothetical protein [Streptomyces cupreus]
MSAREELLAEGRRVLWAGLIDSGEEFVSAAPQIFIDAGMLVESGGAAELERLRSRVAELTEQLAALQAQQEVLRGADGITQRIAPTQALREDDPFHLHHTYRVSRDLPETGGAPC